MQTILRVSVLIKIVTVMFFTWFCGYWFMNRPATVGTLKMAEQTFARRNITSANVLAVTTPPMKCSFSATEEAKNSTVCVTGTVRRKDQCLQCSRGTFSFEGWVTCKDHLNCDEIAHDVRRGRAIGTVGNWKVFSAEWKEYEVIHAQLTTDGFPEEDVDLNSLSELFPHLNFLYVIGQCTERKNKALIFSQSSTILGNARQLDVILNSTGCNNWKSRFSLSMDYVRVLHHIHTKPRGRLTLCNSHTLHQLLTQFVVTEDLRLKLAGYDNLPVVVSSGIKCSKSELHGNFVAPEQKWPFGQIKVFNDREQPMYNHKSDIWKIPDVITFFMSADCERCMDILDYLFVIFQFCKKDLPTERPSALGVLQELEDVWKMLA